MGSKLGKDNVKAVHCHPALFNLCRVHYVKDQAGIKISRRNINNLRYADDTTLMAENEEELNSLLMKMKEECEKAGLKLNIQNALRPWHPVPSFHGK